MRRLDSSVIGGILLILVGGLFLLQQMGILRGVGDIFGIAFLLGGVAFRSTYRSGSWWAVIPGCALAGIGAQFLLPKSLEALGGLVFLGAIGVAFWLIYLSERQERWWALIPAGVMTTLGIVSVTGDAGGGVFFLGLAATFGLVALLAKMRWAFYPAAALGILGFLLMLSLGGFMNYISAVLLIGAGAFLLYRYFRPQASP